MCVCVLCEFLISSDDLQKRAELFNASNEVAPRTAPALKKVKRKPPKVASFANIEKDAPTEEERARTEMAKFMEDGVQRGVCLSIVAKKLLSEAKIPVTSRTQHTGHTAPQYYQI